MNESLGTLAQRLTGGPASRRSRDADERGSMAMYLTLAVVGIALAGLLVPMVVTNARTTRLNTTRVHAVDAAQAGIDVMVGRIRAADEGGVGSSELLPCEPLRGTANSAGTAEYEVKVDYYMEDPVAEPTAAKMRCVEGYGTYDSASDSFTPGYARITALGTDGPQFAGGTKGRTLTATYVFLTSNKNIVGGRMRIYPGTSTAPELCMDATTDTPPVGTVVRMQACTSPLEDRQIWAYRSDLTVQLLSSITGTYPNGLCLDTQAPPTAGRSITLQACAVLGSPPYTQQWSFNDSGAYQASLPNSKNDGVLSSLCIAVPAQSVGIVVTLATCDNSVTSPVMAWIPAPTVGAGGAEAPQLINFYEFGRCLDVSGQNPAAIHLIDYPCKQNPFPAAVAWNQKWTLPAIPTDGASAVGAVYTTRSGTRYCLTSPGTLGGYVTTQPCSSSGSGSTSPNQTWTVYNGDSSLPYSKKYTIVDNTGKCLGLNSPSALWPQWSSIDVERCTGATEHKWNADQNLTRAAIQDLNEL
jgi:hypothetical protein